MDLSYLAEIKANNNVLGVACILKDGSVFHDYRSFQKQSDILQILTHIIENIELNSFCFHDSIFRVIQRDSYHVIAITSPINRQRCIAVYLTFYGRIAIEFFWNPPNQANDIFQLLDKYCSKHVEVLDDIMTRKNRTKSKSITSPALPQ